jgi:PfaD family protein
VPALTIDQLGNPAFKATHKTRYAYYTGAMANGIASEKMVIALGKAGLLGSFGSAGLVPTRVEAAIHQIQSALPEGPYLFNLINSPSEPALEQKIVELYLKHGISSIEAAAYLFITTNLAYYRAAGLSLSPSGEIIISNRITAKLSRKEVARHFLSPAPADILSRLVAEGKISELQTKLAQQVPMADDITVEADSGGHTDNRPLVCILPAIIALRDEFQAKYSYSQPVRIGAAGGIGTPESALAAFMMGASYIVTGSVNQACVESGASEHTKALLAKVEMTDVSMAPSADMFEMGVKVQVLKRGTMFAVRANKLYELYTHYDSLDAIPAQEREKLETQVFKKDFDTIWSETVQFFSERDPRQVERAEANPKEKMALLFRWYLGLSSRWSTNGEKGREMDYQIWCGPAMGAFNDWTRGTYLAEPANRHVVDVAYHILTGCAYLYRLRMLNLQGVHLSASLEKYIPTSPLA